MSKHSQFRINFSQASGAPLLSFKIRRFRQGHSSQIGVLIHLSCRFRLICRSKFHANSDLVFQTQLQAMRLNFWILQCFKFSALIDVSSCLTLHWFLLRTQHDKIRYTWTCNFILDLLSIQDIYILQSTSIYFSSSQWAIPHKALRWRCCRTICILWLWSSIAVASRLCIFCGCAALDRLFPVKSRNFKFI